MTTRTKTKKTIPVRPRAGKTERPESGKAKEAVRRLVVIDDLNLISIAVAPLEADSPLAVDANGVLAGSFSGEGFQPISGRHAQILGPFRGIELNELSKCGPRRASIGARAFFLPEAFGVSVGERTDHGP